MLTTLRGKFLILILLPVLAALVGLTGLCYTSARHHLIEQMKKAGLDALAADAEAFRAVIVQERTALETLGAVQMLKDFSDDERRRVFVSLDQQLGPHITSVFMGFPDGRMVRSKHAPLPGDYDPRTRLWYNDALALPAGRRHGTTMPHLDATTGRMIITAFQKVVAADGTLIGVMGLDLDIALVAGSLSRHEGLPEGGARFIVSDDATVLVHPDVSRVGSRLHDTGQPMDAQMAAAIKDPAVTAHQLIGRRDGGDWYMGFHHIDDTRGNIVLMLPADGVLRPLTVLVTELILLSAVFLLVLTGGLLTMNRRITRPVAALTRAAEKVVADNEYQEALAVSTRDELGRLTEAFNVMMKGLRQRDFIRDTFGRYVTKEVVETLLDNPDGLRLGGELREVTIMFADIRGFTPLSERLDPEQVVDVLNRYLGAMSAVVERHQGTVSEFVGDSVLAFFGAPVAQANSAARAVTCAVEMQVAMEAFNSENAEKGLPELSVGIGINTGEVIVGNIGSERRVKYGVVGHEINLTARVEAATVGGQILVTDATYRAAAETAVIRGEQTFRFKGVEEAVVLYDIAGVNAPKKRLLPELAPDARPLAAAPTVRVARMKDKRSAAFTTAGQLTHCSARWARILIPETIPPPAEVRVSIGPHGDTAEADIYGRVVETTGLEKGVDHVLRISYIDPAVSKRLLDGDSASREAD
jgi:class 3 adenylate cyclase